MRRHAAVALMLLSWCSAVFAGTRLEVVARFSEVRVAGARACFSARLKPKGERILDGLVSGPETRCLPADKVLSLPAGIWHMYVVLDDPFLVSMHPAVLIRGSNSSDDDDVKRIISELVPAATLNVEAAVRAMKPGESLALYVTNSRSKISPASLVPVPPGATEMPVPAGTPVVPLVMKGTEIEAVGERVTIDVGGRADAAFPRRNAATVVVPFWLPDADEKLDRPLITVMHRRLAKPLARYTPADADYRGLIFVENVERGQLDIMVDGTAVTAKPLRAVVAANMNGKVITSDDLVMPVANTWTTVAWTIDEQVAKDVRAATRCEGAPAQSAPGSLKLYSCAAGRKVSRPSQLADCTLVRETTLPKEISGNVRWLAPLGIDDATDGALNQALVELTYGGISVFEPVSFKGSKPASLRINLAPRYITGRITNRGEPIAAEVACGGPIQTTDVAGYYRCWRPPVSSAVILTNPCDGSGTYQQAFDDAATVVDVQIATNTLTVKVLDASTGEPLENASVSLWEGSPNQVPEPDSSPLGPTDKSGEVSASRLEPRKVAVCAYKKEFERSCDENVTVEHDADVKVTLKMQRESLVRGKIASPAEIVEGRLFLMTGPMESGDTAVERDGTFTLISRPPAGTAFVLTSASLPLCVLRAGPVTDTINLSIPSWRPQAFVVTSQTMRTPITLELGGVLLSSNAFARHQRLRHAPYVVAPGRPLTVDAVDGALGVTVVVGAVAIANAPPSNPATLPRYPVGDRTSIELP